MAVMGLSNFQGEAEMASTLFCDEGGANNTTENWSHLVRLSLFVSTNRK
jgi:hypothetical protein